MNSWSEFAFTFRLAFDYQLADGSYLVDRILKENTLLASGEQRYLEQLRGTALIPYEVLEVRPGASVLLRNLVNQETVEVREKTASKELKRWDILVARVNPLGPSGGAELEMGVIATAPVSHEEIKDQLYQEYMAKHTQQWLDDQIPALDLQTPRQAAQSATLRPRLVELLKDIENGYLRALAAGEPAFDPTWMWDELGLTEHQDAPRVRHAVQLAHESLSQSLPGLWEVVEAVAKAPFAEDEDVLRTAVSAADLRSRPEVLELARHTAGRLTSAELLAQLEFYCNYELHRRKTFWIDESLAWMLANTQVDAEASLFRLPFPSYVLVYTDRHTLGVAERALAGGGQSPLRGQMLSVLCAYVSELAPDSPQVKIGLTFDALAGQPPHLMSWELHIDRGENLEKAVADALARAQTPVAGLFQPLLEAVINATLSTTSASVKLDQYRQRPPQPAEDPERLPSDEVYYLPGKIKISNMRKMQQLARGPSGRALLHRFMVRGHWRRPSANWSDQSLRWIEPYWRGPSLASIVEREYRVTP